MRALASLPLLLLPACAPPSAALADRDLLLVTLDTTRADHLGAYGYARETTPFLDQLAAEGVRFERAWAAAPLTLVSHATILTGLDPPRHGVRNNGYYRLPDDLPTLTEALSSSGRTTAAFVSASVLDARHGLARGFAHYDDEVAANQAHARTSPPTRDARSTVARAAAWISARRASETLFVWLHLFDPHAPYTPSPELSATFGTDRVSLYDAELRATDDALAELASALRSNGRAPLWVVTADHGEGLGEHGELTHGTFLYETTLRVPLIVSAPGALEPRVLAGPARHVDLLPTVLDLLDLPLPGPVDGCSLADAIRGNAAQERPVGTIYAETLHPYELYGWSPLFAWIEGDWKYVEAPRPELYDLARDPAELADVVSEEPRRVERMRAALEQVRASSERNTLELDYGQRRELAALGYAEASAPPPGAGPLPDPKDRHAFALAMDRALTLIETGRELEGIDLLASAAEGDPTNPRLLEHLSLEPLRLLEDDPRHPQRERLLVTARGALPRWAALRPEEPDVSYARGLLLELEGDVEGARRVYLRVAGEHDGHLLSRSALLSLAIERGDDDATRRLAHEVLELDPGQRWARHAAARLALEEGANEEALLHYGELRPRSEGPELALVLLRSGQCLQALGRHREALDAFRAIAPEWAASANLPVLIETSRAALEARDSGAH